MPWAIDQEDATNTYKAHKAWDFTTPHTFKWNPQKKKTYQISTAFFNNDWTSYNNKQYGR